MSELDWLLLGWWAAFALACWAMRGVVMVRDAEGLRATSPHESQGPKDMGGGV